MSNGPPHRPLPHLPWALVPSPPLGPLSSWLKGGPPHASSPEQGPSHEWAETPPTQTLHLGVTYPHGPVEPFSKEGWGILKTFH